MAQAAPAPASKSRPAPKKTAVVAKPVAAPAPKPKTAPAPTPTADTSRPKPAPVLPSPVIQDPVSKDSAASAAVSADTVKVHPVAFSLADTANPAPDSLPAREAPKFRATFNFYEIEDPDLVADLWSHAGREGAPEEGHYQILKVTDSSSRSYLMREGTQVGGRLPDSVVTRLRGKIRARSNMTEGRLSQSFLGNFWNPSDPLQPFQWQTGLSLDVRNALTMLRNSAPQAEQHLDVTLTGRPIRWVTLEAGGHLSRMGGGLQRNIYEALDDNPKRGFWGDSYSWGHVALGLPAVKWEIALANSAFPEYYWLDPEGGGGSYILGRQRAGQPTDSSEGFHDAVLIRQWRAGGSSKVSSPNLSHTLHVKLGQIRYSATFDEDVYNSVIQRIMFDDLPAPFGRWGFGFVTAQGASHSLLHFDLFPWTIGSRTGAGNFLRVCFVRLDLAVHDSQTFHVGATTSFLLDGPILRGGNP